MTDKQQNETYEPVDLKLGENAWLVYNSGDGTFHTINGESILISKQLHDEVVEFISDIMDDCKILEAYAIQAFHEANHGMEKVYRKGDEIIEKLRGEV